MFAQHPFPHNCSLANSEGEDSRSWTGSDHECFSSSENTKAAHSYRAGSQEFPSDSLQRTSHREECQQRSEQGNPEGSRDGHLSWETDWTKLFSEEKARSYNCGYNRSVLTAFDLAKYPFFSSKKFSHQKIIDLSGASWTSHRLSASSSSSESSPQVNTENVSQWYKSNASHFRPLSRNISINSNASFDTFSSKNSAILGI